MQQHPRSRVRVETSMSIWRVGYRVLWRGHEKEGDRPAEGIPRSSGRAPSHIYRTYSAIIRALHNLRTFTPSQSI